MIFSIIIPTTGRPELAGALESLRSAGLRPSDEVVVVADGQRAFDRALPIVDESGITFCNLLSTEETRDWGMTQRNVGMAEATGTHLMFLDDDDMYLPHALDLVRGVTWGGPIIARTEGRGVVVPPLDVRDASTLGVGEVGTENLIVPNEKDLLPAWPSAYAGDGLFAVEMMRRFLAAGHPTTLVDFCVARVSDHPADGMWGSVAIATRIAQHPDPGFFNCWTRLMREGLRDGDMIIDAPIGQATHHAADTVVSVFLTDESYAGCDTLCMVDYDHGFGPDTLDRLRDDHRGAGLGMLAAFYMARTSMLPLIYRQTPGTTWNDPLFDVYGGWVRGDVVDVDCCPLGFTLIRRRLLMDVGGVEGPWFWYCTPRATEDVAFSRAARKLEYRLGVHTGVPIKHVIRGVLDPYPD